MSEVIDYSSQLHGIHKELRRLNYIFDRIANETLEQISDSLDVVGGTSTPAIIIAKREWQNAKKECEKINRSLMPDEVDEEEINKLEQEVDRKFERYKMLHEAHIDKFLGGEE